MDCSTFLGIEFGLEFNKLLVFFAFTALFTGICVLLTDFDALLQIFVEFELEFNKLLVFFAFTALFTGICVLLTDFDALLQIVVFWGLIIGLTYNFGGI